MLFALLLLFTATAAALLGDVDGDRTITVVDATFIQRKLLSFDLPFVFIENVADTDDFSLLVMMSDKSGLPIPPNLAALKDAPALHEKRCAKEDMEAVVADFAARQNGEG